VSLLVQPRALPPSRALDREAVNSVLLFALVQTGSDAVTWLHDAGEASVVDHRRTFVGLSQVRSWSHWFVLRAILWAFIAKSRQNLPKLTSDGGSKGLSWWAWPTTGAVGEGNLRKT
jgi:hypothetical protein